MEPNTQYTFELADGTTFTGISDGAGNYVTTGLDSADLTPDNLSRVAVSENGGAEYVLVNQVLRTCYSLGGNQLFVRFSDMNQVEELQADYNAKLDYLAAMTGVDFDDE